MGLPLLAFAFFFVFSTTSQAKTITTLPGYSGDLPFPLETGYVSVGENKEVQLFYYFAESERSSSDDPLLLWITGGPGCSSAIGFFFQSGPLTFVIEEYDGSLPKLQLNEYRWTKEVNMLYVDVPFGTGFSYTESTDGPDRNDDNLVAHTYDFIKEWLKVHPQFSSRELYLGGDGYSGKPVPVIIQNILDGNQVEQIDPPINIKGYVIGNPGTQNSIDFNAQITFANMLAFVPDRLYQSAYENCGGNFIGNDSDACATDYLAIKELLSNVNWIQILEPTCKDITNDPFPQISSEICIEQVTDRKDYAPLNSFSDQKHLELNSHGRDKYSWCRNYTHKLCATWANDEQVQAALGVPEGAVSNWQYCNDANYSRQIESAVGYHKNFSANYNLRALIYSGDHDISIPHIATQQWIDSLGLTQTESWRAWSYQNETAGYTRSFKENNYNLTYATIKGGGHFAAETNVIECAVMVSRWMAYSDL